MDGTQLNALRHLAAGFRRAVVEARTAQAPSALPYFPEGACRLTSRLLALHLARRSDSASFGQAFLVSGILPGSESGARHYWLEVDETVVDLTADAFGQRPVAVGAPTAFHEALTDHVREAAALHLAALSADDTARLARQLAAIEQRLPAFAPPPAT